MGHASPVTGSGHEHREANIKLIVYSTLGLIVVVVIVLYFVVGLFNVFNAQRLAEERKAAPVTRPNALPPEPRLQDRPWEEIQGMRVHENQVLKTYGWSDAKANVAHIPIDKAMDLVIERGLLKTAAGAKEHAGK